MTRDQQIQSMHKNLKSRFAEGLAVAIITCGAVMGTHTQAVAAGEPPHTTVVTNQQTITWEERIRKSTYATYTAVISQEHGANAPAAQRFRGKDRVFFTENGHELPSAPNAKQAEIGPQKTIADVMGGSGSTCTITGRDIVVLGTLPEKTAENFTTTAFSSEGKTYNIVRSGDVSETIYNAYDAGQVIAVDGCPIKLPPLVLEALEKTQAQAEHRTPVTYKQHQAIVTEKQEKEMKNDQVVYCAIGGTLSLSLLGVVGLIGVGMYRDEKNWKTYDESVAKNRGR